MKTTIRLDYHIAGGKVHFKSITLPYHPRTVWRALEHGMISTRGLDIRKLRAQRKRKGGKRGY